MSTINSISEYLEIINNLDDDFIFRGQTSDWELVPKIGRNSVNELGYEDWETLEDDLLDKFIREVSLLLDKEPERKIDWLILGQHYGLPTRLLDWTSNPLKALFFACTDRFDDNGILYLLSPNGFNEDSLDGKFNFYEKGFNVFYPKLNNERIALQEGCFIIYPLPKNTSELVEINKQNFPNDIDDMKKLTVPSIYKRKLLKELNVLGINHKTMFSGVEGICRKICYEMDYPC
ncbi:FRG domain-containing protein [Labilibaculum sp. DW002]|uniref:FRG domain-containing protein n=1 Tax=Paralabilibaculum antarcticum TaxID=2912572 RepID=A0ABT5VRU6_9BACT|nr:FRG domain-containing protein [Labilibaculum sp. DW002]MDE5418007.1 FRG domain-containing protein [Labilibaculum sp. DW002]